MFIHNAWYVIAWDFELADDRILPRTVLGRKLIAFRTADGLPAVLEDRCCHRAAPLSLGRREGDSVRCLYHGLRFDASGCCVEIPGQSQIPPKARVRAFPAVQRTRWVWVWMGDPARADPALIPDTFSLDHPQWRTKPGYKMFKAPISLIADNLLDFSHLSYVHEATLGGSTAIAESVPTISSDGERIVRVSRHVSNTPLAPYHRRFASFTGPVNRWWDYELSVSGMFIMSSGAQSVDRPLRDPVGALTFHSCQALTPETEHSTHYFFSQAHNFALDQPEVTESIYQSIATAFEEDRRMIEAQTAIIADDPDREMLGIAADSALTRYRRLVRVALEAERASMP